MTRLADYTTIGLGGPAGRFVTATTDEELIEAAGDGALILGGGSNLVVADEGFPGTVVRVATSGVRFDHAPDDAVDVTVAAGEPWDDVVAATVGEGLAGLECLSGIPGSTGATPIQNVGAYGSEVAEVITSVKTNDSLLHNDACGFSYRTSIFKRAPGRYVVLGVTFRLPRSKLSAPIRYADLAAELGVPLGEQVAAADARDAVIAVRRRKGMVTDPTDPDSRSAGSFFTNPVITQAEYEHVSVRSAIPVPSYDAGEGLVKVPAAWLIEHAGFVKGYAAHGARISTKHTLALTNPGSATTAGLLALARDIREGVEAAFGVTLTPEPILIGASL
ncbi:MAG: UDP-N-acetylmuramate dehydrogenase [Streptosporangiaceae bacterium]